MHDTTFQACSKRPLSAYQQVQTSAESNTSEHTSAVFAWSSCVSLCQTDNHSTKVDPPRHRRVDAAAVISFKWLLNAHKLS